MCSCGVREKDGVLAALCLISVLIGEAKRAGRFVPVKEVVENHCAKYGLNYSKRNDFEEVEKEKAEQMMDHIWANAATVKVGFGTR